jgi:hypothetical protein
MRATSATHPITRWIRKFGAQSGYQKRLTVNARADWVCGMFLQPRRQAFGSGQARYKRVYELDVVVDGQRRYPRSGGAKQQRATPSPGIVLD